MSKVDNLNLAKVASSTNIKLSIGQFLDDFRYANDKYTLIKDEPSESVDIVTLSIMASIAHKLANDNGLAPPRWVFRKIYVLQTPIYAHNTNNTEYQRFLTETSPPEFAQRNIYYGANALARV